VRSKDLFELTPTPKRMAERAHIILWAADGKSNKEIAEKLRTRTARVCKWRNSFAHENLKAWWIILAPVNPQVYG